MIRVSDLHKRYGAHPALRGISFEVGKGEIVGFLGPNGAGKTTTLRILAAYLRPTAGRAEVDGLDVTEAPLEVRRRMGYLPESAPLYLELRVREYLDFRARLRELPRAARRAAVETAVEQCGLGAVRDRLIGALSHGFRQRVGLADALLACPPILVLDEPTVGLDPAQAREIRALVRALGRDHTVLLSTHLLPEVEVLCDRAVILARGRVVADARLVDLTGAGPLLLVCGREIDRARAVVSAVDGVQEVAIDTGAPEPTLRARAVADRDVREAVARALHDAGIPLRELRRERRSLEQVFLEAVSREAEVG